MSMSLLNVLHNFLYKFAYKSCLFLMSTLPANRSSKAANSPISNKSLRMKASLRSCSGRSRDPCWPWMAMPSVLALRTFSLCSALFGWKWRQDLVLLTLQSRRIHHKSKFSLSAPRGLCRELHRKNTIVTFKYEMTDYKGRVCVCTASHRVLKEWEKVCFVLLQLQVQEVDALWLSPQHRPIHCLPQLLQRPPQTGSWVGRSHKHRTDFYHSNCSNIL